MSGNTGEKTFIPTRAIFDIIGLILITLVLVIIGYFTINANELFSVNIEKLNNPDFNAFHESVSAFIAISKIQLLMTMPLLLILLIWAIFMNKFLGGKSGLTIDNSGIKYVPVLFKPKKEQNNSFTIQWNDIDRFEISAESLGNITTGQNYIVVYLNPGFEPKNKMEKLVFNMVKKMASEANKDDTKIEMSYKIKRLNADNREVKELLDNRLKNSRSAN